MTEKELNELYYIEIQIGRLKRRIAEIKGEMFGGGVSGMPRSSTPGNPTERIALKKVALLEQLNKALEDKIDAEISIRAFIDSVDDMEIKTIIELRCIEFMGWQEIGEKLHADRTTVAKKFRSYLKKLR